MKTPIILASNSPRRKELLRQIGLDFTTDPADVDESMLPHESPESYAMRVALDKARVAAGRVKSGVIIGADTIVVLDDKVFGKPVDSRDAGQMLAALSGRMHQVITGLAVMDVKTERVLSRASRTRVWFRRLSGDEINAYVISGEPLDKAGAYGIQERGALLVERIEGCYFNVVGLPLSLLGEMLAEFGIRILS